MGSCSDDPNIDNGSIIDASVGSLVWVRRRNGSWWPGRIMGLNEISDGSLVSPRSGTPVKLLGREDASVDWYNLEKSKRVKAFRCGEYDECIEKAKANAANGNKRAVKYARREDAILHALELENIRLGKDHVFIPRNKNSGGALGSSVKESPGMTNSVEEDVGITDEEEDDEERASDSKEDSDSVTDSDSGSDSDSDDESDSDSDSDDESDSDSDDESDSSSGPELSQSGISFEEPNNFVVCKMQSVQGKRRRTPNDSEDDGTEGIKRMRGLEDLGMVVGDSNAGNCFSNGSPSNGCKVYSSSMKRRRSQVANVHEFLKRKNRHRPLTKVLESTAMVSVPVICDQVPNLSDSPLHGLSESKISGIDSNESKKSFSVAANNNSDSTGVSCENSVSLNPSEHAHDASQVNCKLKENGISGVSGLAENDSSDRLFDVPFVGEEKHSAGRNQVGGLGRQSSQSSQAEALPLKNEGFNEAGSTSSAATHFNSFSPRTDKDASKWQLKRKRNSRHTSKIRKQEKRKYLSMNGKSDAYLAGLEHCDGFFPRPDQKVDFDGTRRPLASYKRNLEGKSRLLAGNHVDSVPHWSKSFSHRENHLRGAMMEVSLPPQRLLPYRQSRFTVNSRYPISDYPGRTVTGSKLYDVKLDVKANYQPQNVPLVSLMSKLNGKAIIGRPLTIEQLVDGSSDDIVGSIECDPTYVYAAEAPQLGHTAIRNLGPGRILPKHKTSQARLSPSKSPRRKSGILSKKIRKLSSLTGNKEVCRKPVTEKPKGPVIACIPLKVVFSRINEAVNGTARQTHRAALTSSNS
ncbi:uncharacterized protein At1g51745-like [Mercurialis annua]|uniref:uncharacterized protein At1g51745-like n=1 Tax=Mercurialis annua TaxID=3986 RepID=UPI00215E7EF7|nr:uncharacterized protein At1g51745-like [Mercurialis annua]XP_050232338.1 uncharacterized protein At1g51745-like [Mercurialis annua]